MSAIAKFKSFLKGRQYAVEALNEFFSIMVEPIEDPGDGARGYRLRPLPNADRITQRCMTIIQETWHCRDYIKKVLEENGHPPEQAGQLINGYISNSRDVQVVSYLANDHKHAGVNHQQKWGVDLAPRFGRPFVRGMLNSFPHRMKPTLQIWGDSIPEFEFVGRAGVGEYGENAIPFKDFDWTFSCLILDKDGKALNHAAVMCENAFHIWLKVLDDSGIRWTTDSMKVR